jgi:hypothetical protein
MRNSEYQTHEQWRNIMQNRHGMDNAHTCATCRHLSHTTEAAYLCEQCTTPSGYKMPWNEGNRACGLYEERVKEDS